MRTPQAQQPPSPNPRRFMFFTGIECSYPTIAGEDGRSVQVDELEKTFHYRRWREDLALVREMGLRFLRYGPPYYRAHAGPHRYDWEFTDRAFGEMHRLGIVPIADLCHFGLPDWAGSFQNPDWPELFSRFAGAFAARLPWVRFYTPVNEIYVCARLSTIEGIWNERKSHDYQAFVTAVKHLCKANLLAIWEILKVRPDAVFIQSESTEYYHLGSSDPATMERAAFENERRFLSFDLLYSIQSTRLGCYLLDNGMTRDEYLWFMGQCLGDRIIMGNDYYEWNEHVVASAGMTRPSGEVFGWPVIAHQYFSRYRRPIVHTETNVADADRAPRWLWKEFFNVRNLRERGVPVLGFTWYSLIDQVDWDSALAYDRGVVNPVGLFDLHRRPRPVAAAYQELLREFGTEPLVPHCPALQMEACACGGDQGAATVYRQEEDPQ